MCYCAWQHLGGTMSKYVRDSMDTAGNSTTATRDGGQPTQGVPIPQITLPKGGGAVSGIGEKFTANPVTGTGSFSVPLRLSPGRSGFGPQLSLSYDSGSGNGIFGLGWDIGLPAISRKTEKGLPRYLSDNSDVFILSGAEDLVPELEETDSRWQAITLRRVVASQEYRVVRYRPRIEGLFARIEYWVNTQDDGDCFWRSISKENVTTWYGRTSNSRIADPNDHRRVFRWLICQSHDDKGNVINYDYASEDSTNVDAAYAHERQRSAHSRSANRYIKRITYGNSAPFYPLLQQDAPWPDPGDNWLFEAVFDYGDHEESEPVPEGSLPWPVREDPFSRYRAGFEVRTYRLCRRVLMFHHFEGNSTAEEEAGKNYLVRSTDIVYGLPSQEPHRPYTHIRSVTQTSYRKLADGSYVQRSVPPVAFSYSQPVIGSEIKNMEPESLENLPLGVDGSTYRWVDLDGEGASGVLTSQADGWFYKPNNSPLHRTVADDEKGQEVSSVAALGESRLVAPVPAGGMANGARQLLDVDGDGRIDLVQLDRPLGGYFECSPDGTWENFAPFDQQLTIDWQDPNVKLLDVTGDGHADAVITEADAIVWHQSLATKGFADSRRSHVAADEDLGPKVLFADNEESIFQSDFSGDGLADIVRIRNGEVCYWPNKGYGTFGEKIVMDTAPRFEIDDQFSSQRLRLVDIDGSGTVDIIYLGRQRTTLWFNQSGNSWSDPVVLAGFPLADNLATVAAVDLLGNGTACLTWSSPLPGDQGAQLRYVELMAQGKPHLLTHTTNNMGAETTIEYAPSTHFYVKDKVAGTPWVTRLPFPVHVVERVIVTDVWRKTRFASTYSYHHGYFDGREREFRGFGRVEQIDVESFGTFTELNSSPYVTDDETLYQPPVKTVTWFHTGASFDREKMFEQYRHEYFPQSFGGSSVGDFVENYFPEPATSTLASSDDEWHEASRACKSMTLRQETYELDAAALAEGQQVATKIFSAAYHDYTITKLQPKIGDSGHGVFLVTESEAISYTYDLDLTINAQPDPRIAHTLNVAVDRYGNVTDSVAVAYPRLVRHDDDALPEPMQSKIQQVQNELHLAYNATQFTNDSVDTLDAYRLRVPCEVQTYDLTGVAPLPENNGYITLAQLKNLDLTGESVERLEYQTIASGLVPQKRIVEWVRMLFFDSDVAGPLPFGELNTLALPYETYTLALTESLLDAVLGDKLTPAIEADLQTRQKSGYLTGVELTAQFGDLDAASYWVGSGIAGFGEQADERFYMPERYSDIFGNTTTIVYDEHAIFVLSSVDPVGNTASVTSFNYRVLAPQHIRDHNNNLSQVLFDTLGVPAAAAVLGKGDEGDTLAGFSAELVDLDASTRSGFFTETYDEAAAAMLLGSATARHVYDFGETVAADGTVIYGQRPAASASIVREQHSASLDGRPTPLQTAFQYSDGGGNVLVSKSQAEPAVVDGPLRWIANGKTIVNNKGKPVKQYEPYFSPDHRFEESQALGVTPIIFYDAAGRVVRTELPDGSFSRVEFSPWHVVSFDANDTAYNSDPSLQSDWYRRRSDPDHELFEAFSTAEHRRAAGLVEDHADTPARVFFDSLGRDVIAIAHNRVGDSPTSLVDEFYLTFTKLDAEGKPLWIRDARNNLVMQYVTPLKPHDVADEAMPNDSVSCYDIAGNLLCQHSNEAGSRQMINDAAGQPFYGWDENERTSADGSTTVEVRVSRAFYDVLRRPVEQQLQINGGAWLTIERVTYGEELADGQERNLRGQVHQHFDGAGVVTKRRFDFKGNIVIAQRQLARSYDAEVLHWPQNPPLEFFDEEVFTQNTAYDALNRMVRQENWHVEGREPATYLPSYNERGLLQSETLFVDGESTDAIVNLTYDAKGQRLRLALGNGSVTTYSYDAQTFRLNELVTVPSDDADQIEAYQNLQYWYDPSGNITDIRDTAQQTVFFDNARVEPHLRYRYDALYRLTRAQGREHANATTQRDNNAFTPVDQIPSSNSPDALRNYIETYRYDEVGNILTMSHIDGSGSSWSRFYQYALSSNRLLATSKPGDATTGLNHYAQEASPALSQRYSYDSHGSMTAVDRSVEALQLHIDYRDMIGHINLEASGASQAWYSYDSQKQRTRKRIEKNNGTIVEERLYLGGMEWYRRTENGRLVEDIETHHLFVVDDRVLIVENVLETNNTQLDEGILFRYQYGNHLGSVGLEIDERGRIISYEEYHPYGTTAYSAKNRDVRSVAKRYSYTGMERDEETGLSYHTARYYLPWLARWSSTDPAGLVDGPNVYAYSRNKPTGLSDPSGTQSEPETGVGVGVTIDFDGNVSVGSLNGDNPNPDVGPCDELNPLCGSASLLLEAPSMVSGQELTVNQLAPESSLYDEFAEYMRESAVGQFIAGVSTGGLAGAAPGGFLLGIGVEVTGVSDDLPAYYRLGYGVGETAWGIAQLLVGGGGEVVGGGLTLTGGGAVVGVPVMAGSTALILEAGADIGTGTGIFMSALDDIDSPRPSGSGGGGGSSTPLSPLQQARQAGVDDVIEEEIEVYVHGTTRSFADELVDNPLDTLSSSGGNYGGQFHAAIERGVAERYATASASNAGRGESAALVGLALPRSLVQRLRSGRNPLMRIEPFGDTPGFQVIFESGAIDIIKDAGFFFHLR